MKSYAEGQGVMAGHKGLAHLALSYSDVVAEYAFMLASSEITDAPREAAHAMLQLLFLMVHSLADQITARQMSADNQNSHQPAHTRSKRKPSAAASRLPMLKLEENIVNLRTYLSLFLRDMQLMHTGPHSLSATVWVSLDKGKWCDDQQIPKQLKQDLNCLKDAQVLPSNAIDGIQSCFEAQSSPLEKGLSRQELFEALSGQKLKTLEGSKHKSKVQGGGGQGKLALLYISCDP
ncbi:hypothetical protein WJX82_003917 [Trebouxia sp. C0006]